MRRLTKTLSLAGVFALVGCNSWSGTRTVAPPPPQPTGETPSAAALVSYLNRQADRFQSLEVRDLDLDCRQKGQGAGLQSWLICQKPRNFRLGGKVLGATELDLGSNDQEFWFWIKRNDPPYQYHCSYADLARGVRLPFPFQPEWVLEVLGMSGRDPNGNYEVRVQPTSFELVERTTAATGMAVQKVTVFNRTTASGSTPQVPEFRLIDEQGKLIARATVSQSQVDARTGASYPRKVKLEYPAEQVVLTMILDGVTVNPAIDPARADNLFRRRPMEGVRSFDLARGLDSTPTANTSPIRRTGAFR